MSDQRHPQGFDLLRPDRAIKKGLFGHLALLLALKGADSMCLVRIFEVAHRAKGQHAGLAQGGVKRVAADFQNHVLAISLR